MWKGRGEGRAPFAFGQTVSRMRIAPRGSPICCGATLWQVRITLTEAGLRGLLAAFGSCQSPGHSLQAYRIG